MLNSKTPLLACVLAALLGVGATLGLQNDESVRKVSAVKLPNVPGQTLTAEVVEYPPGGKSSVHHHAGSVFAYILTGRIRSQNSATGPARVYKAGETFFEPPEVIIWSARMQAPANPQACWQSSSPKTEQS